MKTCTKCNIEKPFEAFYKDKYAKDGYSSECKECAKERREKLKKNPLMQLERQIKSSIILENKLLAREGKRLCGKCNEIFLIEDLTTRGYCENCDIEYKKEYYQKNKETLNQKTKEYQQKNKDKTREHSRKSSKKYYEKNKNKIKEYRKEYIEKNKDKIKEYHKEYMKEYEEKNKDKRREHQRKYCLKKKLEKEKANKIDPKAINAFMEELIKIKE
jgi:hypothetical protein